MVVENSMPCNDCIHEDVCMYKEKYKESFHIIMNVEIANEDLIDVEVKCKKQNLKSIVSPSVNMKAETKELYNYTINNFEKELNNKELNNVSLTSVVPIIKVGLIVKKAMTMYIQNYCNTSDILSDNNPFSKNDFINAANMVWEYRQNMN